jgi:hypothetical protein
VFSDEPHGEVPFHEATHLLPEHAHEVARTVQRRVLRAFRRQEILDDATVSDMLDWQATRGFSVDASVRIEGDDRAGVDLLERLSRLISPPRVHRHRYHGVLAPHARLRPAVVAIGRDGPDTDDKLSGPAAASSPAAGHSNSSGAEHSRPVDPPPARSRASRLAWALLLARIYEVLPLLCPP